MRLRDCLLLLLLARAIGFAQVGLRGQIYLPNGSPPQRPIRFTLATQDRQRIEIFFTDSNGRLAVLPPPNMRYTITVESDGQTYGTTVRDFDPLIHSNYITIHLEPLRTDPKRPAGLIDVTEVDQKVSPKAKQAYDSALELLRAEKYDQAIEQLKQAIALQKDYFLAHNDLAVAYMKMKQFALAEQTLRQALSINSKVYIAHLNLGIVLNHQGKHKEAAEVLLKLEERQPGLWSLFPPLIEALMESHQWPAAETEIQKALAFKDADLVDLKTKMGIVQIRQAKYSAAIAPLREAVAAEPDNAVAQFNLGLSLLQTNSLAEAEAALSRAYQLKGKEMAGAQLMLGQLFFQKNDYRKAAEAFETYLRDLPDAPNRAQVEQAIKQLREAIK